MGIQNLNCFFNPKAIAVIGASEDKDALGARILCNLIGAYKGLIFPVNPFRQTIQGITAYSNISKIPNKIDLAIISTPAHTVPQIVEECGKAQVSGVIIVSAGFSECDPEGQRLTRQILEHKKTYGIRIIGPNSLGVIRPKNGLYATFGDKKAIPGKIAFISQSAALCGTVLDWSQETKVGLSAVVAIGSTIDVDIGDLIDYFGADPQTRAIMLYVESIKNIRNFISSARGFARTKPIVIVKAGRSNERHSFALSNISKFSKDTIYDAVFRRIGIVRAETINDLFDCAKALSMQPNPCSPSLTIITNAGGPGLLAADQLALRGGQLSQVSKTSLTALSSILPNYCGVSNPIDILEEATLERFRNVLQVCFTDPPSGSILVIHSPQGVTNPYNIAKSVLELSEYNSKTLLVTLMGEDINCQEARRMLNLNGIPAFKAPEEAVLAFMNMYSYTNNLESLYQTPEEIELNLGDPIHLKPLIRKAFCEGRHILSLPESFALLNAYKIPSVKSFIVKTTEEASAQGCELGYPVTLKPLHAQAKNKRELTKISNEVYSAAEVPKIFNQLSEKINSSNFSEFEGLVIQPKIRDGYELFLGLRKDEDFGSIIVFGTCSKSSGEIDEISVGFPPLNQVLARQLIEKATFFQNGTKAEKAFKTGIVEEIMVKFSQLVVDFPEIKEIDLNPLVVTHDGALATDTCITIDMDRVRREQADHHEHLVIAPYPKKYITHRTLKNGLLVTLRPIKPEDEEGFNELFKSLSEESVRFRFFEIIKEMSHDTLSRYCNLDYDREIAIVAELQNDGRLIGVVRLIPDLDMKHGEFAIMVGDSWHSLGLGSKLMDCIIDAAKDMKLEAIYSMVTRSNYKMTGLCHKKGFETQPVDEYTVNMSLNLPC